MKTINKNKIVNWDDHLDKKYEKLGTATREKYDEEFGNFWQTLSKFARDKMKVRL